MTLAETLESFADQHGLTRPDTTALREAEARFDALLTSALRFISSSTKGRREANNLPPTNNGD